MASTIGKISPKKIQSWKHCLRRYVPLSSKLRLSLPSTIGSRLQPVTCTIQIRDYFESDVLRQSGTPYSLPSKAPLQSTSATHCTQSGASWMSPEGHIQRNGLLQAHISQALWAEPSGLASATCTDLFRAGCGSLCSTPLCHGWSGSWKDCHCWSLPIGTMLSYIHQPLLRLYSDLVERYSISLVEL